MHWRGLLEILTITLLALAAALGLFCLFIFLYVYIDKGTVVSPAELCKAIYVGGFGTRTAAIGNLFVKAGQTTPLADLKTRLIQLCKDRDKPYGMLVRKLDFPFSADNGELQALSSASTQSGGSVRPVSPPVLIYRVYPDGREELVRGLRFRGVSSRSLRDILAANSGCR